MSLNVTNIVKVLGVLIILNKGTRMYLESLSVSVCILSSGLSCSWRSYEEVYVVTHINS